jgi:lipoprotein-anchoring transpeptidase ErfK/SrfK
MNPHRSTLFLIASWMLAAWTLPTSALLGEDTRLLISVEDQKMVLLRDGAEIFRFPVSTSKFGLGDRWGSFATPTGTMQVAQKIGDNAREGAVFKERRLTGEVLPPNAPGRDPIVTRILWLRGLEPQNANCFKRCIYIHGTPEERLLGAPVSWGCIRMRSKDVVRVFESVAVGTKVEVVQKPLKVLLKEYAAKVRLAQVKGG